jgi:predicted dehydrogenase
MNLAILGAGNIGNKMATTVKQMEGVTLYAVASRSLAKAKEFAQKHSIPKAYGSYEEMLKDRDADLVYVCTPHSHHYEHMKLALEHNKHVLCEKAFTVNARQAKEILDLGKRKGLLVAEAIWTRYLPMRTVLDQILARRVIGEVQTLTANLAYPVSHVERMWNPDLAAGSLLDLSVYTINFAMMVFGNRIETIHGVCTRTKTGVDESNSITLTWAGGKMATLHASMIAYGDRRGALFGTKGYIEFENINNCEGIRVYDKEYNLIETYKPSKQITGFEFQAEACKRAIEEGKTECDQMPHSEILNVMNVMDELRRQWNLVYPME